MEYEYKYCIKFPCNIGDTVYRVTFCNDKPFNILKQYVSAVHVEDRTETSYIVLRYAKGDLVSARVPISKFGKIIFLSLEDVFKTYPDINL